jgi:hypothetical protein
MMSPDLTPAGPQLDSETLRQLSASLQAFLQDGAAPGTLESALQRVAAEARERGVPAERLLIALKDLWYSLPPVERAASVDEQNRMLQRIITLSIRAYYQS